MAKTVDEWRVIVDEWRAIVDGIAAELGIPHYECQTSETMYYEFGRPMIRVYMNDTRLAFSPNCDTTIIIPKIRDFLNTQWEMIKPDRPDIRSDMYRLAKSDAPIIVTEGEIQIHNIPIDGRYACVIYNALGNTLTGATLEELETAAETLAIRED